MNNELEEGLKGLFTAISARSDKEAMDTFAEAIIKLKDSKTNIENPEYFSCMVTHKLENGVRLLAKTLHEPSICKDDSKPDFIYINYNFLNRHIQNLCALREGSSCCADKSRHILKMYLKYSITGEIPSFNTDIEEYWKPNFGDNQMWIDYCDSLYRLYYGKAEDYFKSYNALLRCEMRKYKHILHRWYIEFNDGDIIEFDYSWDEREKNPLGAYLDKGEFYILSKLKIGEKPFDIYEPEDEEEKFLYGNHFVKIPKSCIKQIFKKSEERMV